MTRRGIMAGTYGGAIRAAMLLASVAAIPAYAATPAGARIVNTAQLATTDMTAVSNTVTLSVDQLLDVAIQANARTLGVPTADTVVPAGFDVTNTGNAAESFNLSGRADVAGSAIVGIAVDTDGNGSYDAAADATLPAPAAVTLSAGARNRIFVLVHGAIAATVTATASAQKGSGAKGTVLTGAGAAGVDVVVGETGASASASTTLTPAAAGPQLEKSQSVLAPDGSARVTSGSVITYRLDARFPGATAAAVVTDAIPQGTRFVPGSITLDGRALTDGDDDDTARFDGATVRVALGDIAAATTRTIRFQAIIQ